MSDRHLKHWPSGVPRSLDFPQTHLWANVAASATRHPDKPCLVFYDSVVTHGQFKQQTEWLAGWLQQVAGVQRGDRVLLCTQNSPQFAIGAYGVLRADAVLVPQQGIARDPRGAATAMVVGKDGKVEARTVTVSRTVGDQWLVESGLKAGDKVIVEGLQKIAPGAPVKAVEAGAKAAPAAK